MITAIMANIMHNLSSVLGLSRIALIECPMQNGVMRIIPKRIVGIPRNALLKVRKAWKHPSIDRKDDEKASHWAEE